MSTAIKKNDVVMVIAGNYKGTKGKVLEVMPTASRILVEGVNKRKHHEKKSQANPEGAIVERERPIHISNVMLAKRYAAKVEAKQK